MVPISTSKTYHLCQLVSHPHILCLALCQRRHWTFIRTVASDIQQALANPSRFIVLPIRPGVMFFPATLLAAVTGNMSLATVLLYRSKLTDFPSIAHITHMQCRVEIERHRGHRLLPTPHLRVVTQRLQTVTDRRQALSNRRALHQQTFRMVLGFPFPRTKRSLYPTSTPHRTFFLVVGHCHRPRPALHPPHQPQLTRRRSSLDSRTVIALTTISAGCQAEPK